MKPFWFVFLPAAVYQCLAITAGFRHVLRRAGTRPGTFRPGVSVLKPLCGLDPNSREAFRSQVCQDYPEFEVLFGVADEDDPAVAEVRRVQSEFPDTSIGLFVMGPVDAANGKVGLLMRLAREARCPVWVVNDSDIKVDSSYLASVVAPLADHRIGLVTCPYRGEAQNAAALWETLGIAVDFMPSALVAPLVGVREFGFGSTLAFRAADLERAGGFAAIADHLADDYQLAKRITKLGRRALLSTYIVETALSDASWRGVWDHQLRWARTIRASKGRGYAGLFLTHTGMWIIAAIASSAWIPAAVLGSLRIGSALLSTALVLRSPKLAKLCWLAPVWDLFAFATWAVSYFGRTIRWRGRELRVDRDGRIQPQHAPRGKATAVLKSDPPHGSLISKSSN